MKCEEFLKQWKNDDLLSDSMKEHLSVCESCRAKVKDYNDILLYIKEDKYPHAINVVDNVMQQIGEKTAITTASPQRNSVKRLVTASLSMAATVALVLMVGWKVDSYNRIRLQNEAIAGMFDDVYGYDNNNQHLSYNELDAIAYFLENYEK